ncbi:MAG: hypothetical protein R3B09_12955 [Nannocystaceae bacterium]
MSGRSTPWIVALALAGACGPPKPSACEQLAASLCAAASLPCADTRELLERAELGATRCEEGRADLEGILAAVSPDVRGLALAIFLVDLLRASPKIDPAELEALRGRLGIPALEGAGAGVSGGAGPTAVGVDEAPTNRFAGYLEVDEPTGAAAGEAAATTGS